LSPGVLCAARQFVHEFWWFGLKQASACIFAGSLLFLVVLTHVWYPIPVLPRFDFLFLSALVIQVVLLATRLEGYRDALVILIFHVVATGMEVFKTSDQIGAWNYPGEAWLRIGNVPLFAGFMYSAVGSYISRVWNIFDFRFSHFPSLWLMFVISGLIYVNFFSHHFAPDIRWPLLAVMAFILRRTFVYYRIDQVHRTMPLLLGLVLVALFIWFAENIATYCRVWFYPAQLHGWTVVSPQKITAWLLLMFISFTLVAAVRSIREMDDKRSL
jgi:uncharacterized membrane protein YoaT (DUF817 family)